MWNFEKIFKVHEWKPLHRKLFVIGFPITIPLYMATLAVALAICLTVIVFLYPIGWAAATWNGEEFDL